MQDINSSSHHFNILQNIQNQPKHLDIMHTKSDMNHLGGVC